MIGHNPRSLKPATIADVQDAVRDADARGEALVIEGGGTLRGMGYPPDREADVLSSTGLRGVKSFEYADLTVSVEAGMTVRALRALLAERGQFVPIDVPRAHEATVGGALASGWTGPRRHVFNRPRDYVIGSQIVLADGTTAAAGGMVVKNVAGYDMSKLYAGSFGTLGMLVAANFKTLPNLAAARAFTARLPENTRLRAIAQMQQLEILPTVALWAHGFRKHFDGEDGDDGRMFLLLEGSRQLVDRGTRDLRSALGRAGVPETVIIDSGALEMYDRALDAFTANLGERSVTYRLKGFPETLDERVRGAYVTAHQHELTAESIVDIINGDVFARVSGKDALAFSERIEAFDDALHEQFPQTVIVAGDSAMRSSLNVWGQEPNGIERMRAIKHQFDPKRTFNPGRFIGRI